MRKKKRKDAELTREEVERQKAKTLPDREVMSTVSVAPQPAVDPDDALFPVDPVPKDVWIHNPPPDDST